MTLPFHIYRSSAGSGKTRTLAREYIELALRSPHYFRYILAMTFTNKSTQEMKDRIIRYLFDFSEGKSDDLAREILENFKKEGRPLTADDLKNKSREILSLILHQYSQFSIGTIDAFFQRIIRSFTRETGLLGNFRLEVENELVMEEVIDLLMAELTEDAELRGWVLDFSLEQLLEGKDWDIRSALLGFSNEIFKEDFKAIEESILSVTERKEFFKEFRQALQQEVKTFEHTLAEQIRVLMNDFHSHGLTVSDFKYGQSGSVYSYLTGLEKEVKAPGSRVKDAMLEPSAWPAPKSMQVGLIKAQAQQRWMPQLISIVTLIETRGEVYYSAEHALKNLYAFGLLSDISRMMKRYLTENNLMLLSDASKFLRGVMQGQDTSFLYEKVGSFYRHFLIDEFQDTSGFQWSNLLPLVKNGIAQNYKSLLVGDIKQSVYRWRGGDLTILQNGMKADFDPEMTATYQLDTNYRSAGNLVDFNNDIFVTASSIISDETGTEFPAEAYSDVAQKIFKEEGKGFVRVTFLSEAEEEKESGEEKSFETLSLEQLPALLEELQDAGVKLEDIAFLVRDNREGQEIAHHFMQYGISDKARSGCRYDVVSNESLRLDQSASVLVIINAMRLLENPDNMVASAHLAYEYQKLWPKQAFPNIHKVFTQSKTKELAQLVPGAFTTQREELAALPLTELAENLIHIFNLGKLTTEIAYLQGFQDTVLEFITHEKSDLTSFLQWWDENKHKKSIQIAGGVDAAQIITIHKSKGLQFKYVVIPFLDWELNHPPMKSPILWCKSDHELFKDAGYIPLKYTSKLETTVFREYYREERRRIYLDNLNLLYVAFTRAEEGLVAFAPITKSNNLSNVGQLVRKTIQSNPNLYKYWQEEQRLFEKGALATDPEEATEQEPLTLRHYAVTPWRERISVSARGKEFFHLTEKRKKINYGIFLHTIMSKIKTRGDVNNVIGDAVDSGAIRGDERGGLTETIGWIVNHPLLKQAFDDGADVKNERLLILPDGSERRIDRLVRHDGGMIVIDYKTGSESSADVEQVREYLTLLKQMGMGRIECMLVYAEERLVKVLD